MSKKRNINTILAQAGIKSDKATGALTTPLHFSTTYQHPEFGQSTGFDYTVRKIQHAQQLKRLWQLSKVQIMLWRQALECQLLCLLLAFSLLVQKS